MTELGRFTAMLVLKELQEREESGLVGMVGFHDELLEGRESWAGRDDGWQQSQTWRCTEHPQPDMARLQAESRRPQESISFSLLWAVASAQMMRVMLRRRAMSMVCWQAGCQSLWRCTSSD